MIKNSLFIFLFALTSCAIISSPEGGEKDITAPTIVETTPPNFGTQFSSDQIIIEFDEYITLKNFGTQFFSSPPLLSKIETRLKGKKLYLSLNEELRPNTTYTFNFGTAITDLTEGNVQANFKYVFSTGPHLDSLSIQGTATDAYTGAPQKGVLAMLYSANIEDSTLLKQKPIYYTVTDDHGHFSIENLALDTFQLFVVKDENINLTYDHGAEKYGFVSYPIISGVDEMHNIRVFTQPTVLKLTESAQKSYGQIQLGFTYPPQNIDVKISGSELIQNENSTYLLPEENGDTLSFWYNPDHFPADLPFLFLDVKATDFEQDSLRIFLAKGNPSLPLLFLDPKGNLKPTDTVFFANKSPIKKINTDSILIHTPTDTLPFTADLVHGNKIGINFERKYGQAQTFTFLPGALTNVFDLKNDTIVIETLVDNEDNLAILILDISSIDNKEKVMQFYKLSTGELVKELPFTNRISLTLKDLSPTKYGLRIFWDDNKNGRYDVGIFKSRTQPEKVMYYPKPIELRANWELETIWEIPFD